ncbi:hypothetical protein Ancab_018306 [Ancistrocladus abbreviatus]
MSDSVKNNKKGGHPHQQSKDVEEREEGIGQGELYSPDHAIQLHQVNKNTKQDDDPQNYFEKHQKQKQTELKRADFGSRSGGMGLVAAGEIKKSMGMMMERLLEKLAAASVPSDALENARQLLESMVRDLTSAAQGLTRNGLQRIKSHLADIFPSLSPSLTSKMVDEAEQEASGHGETNEDSKATGETREEQQKERTFSSPASSLFSSFFVKPLAKL